MAQAERFDVAVVGGGCAGIAAGIAAARGGARTLLLDPGLGLSGDVSAMLATESCPVEQLPLEQLPGRPLAAAPDAPDSQDSQDSQARRNKNSKRGQQLPNFVAHQVIGQTQSGSTAQTESAGALNPELARWLMGYPEEWGLSGATAMQ